MDSGRGNQNTRLVQALVILAVLAAFLYLRLGHKAAPPRAPSPQISVMPLSSISPSRPVPSEETQPRPVATTEEARRSGRKGTLCRLFSRRGIFELPTEYFAIRARAQDATVTTITAVLPEEESSCLTSGVSLKLMLVQMDPEAHLPLGFEARLDAQVLSSEHFESVERLIALSGGSGGKSDPLEITRALPLLGQFFGPESFNYPVRKVRLSIPADAWPDRSVTNARYPNPYAGWVSAQSMENALRKGAVLVDTRVSPQFSALHLESAISVPMPHALFDSDYQPLRELKAWTEGIAFNHQIPLDREIVIYGTDPGSHTPDNLATLLSFLGHRKIQIYRGGFFEHEKIPAATPTQAPSGVSVISAREAAALLSSGALAVDTRRRPNSSVESIKGWDAPWDEMPDAAGRVSRLADLLSAEAISKLRDHWYAPATLLQYRGDVILFGKSEFDWRPLKAAIVLAARGNARKVYWFRGGLSEWLFERKFGEKRPLVRRRPLLVTPPRSR